VWILEANPRASRTVPIVSKVCDIPMARIAAQVMLGAKLRDLGVRAARSATSASRSRSSRSTCSRRWIRSWVRDALHRRGARHGQQPRPGLLQGQQATRTPLPLEGTVLVTVAEADRAGVSRRRASSPGSVPPHGDPRHSRVPGRERHRRGAGAQGPRGPAQHRRRHQERRGPAAREHPRRQAERTRRLVHPQGCDPGQGPLRDDRGGRGDDRQGDRGAAAAAPTACAACRSTTLRFADRRGHGRKVVPTACSSWKTAVQ